MRTIGLMGVMCVAGASMAMGQMLLPGDGVALVEKPQLVEGVVHTNAPVAADTNALAALTAEETKLLAEAKEITIKITEMSYPLREYRQRMMSQDKDLMDINRVIREKQVELEAKLAEKYPDIGAKTKERDELTRKYSDVNSKIRDVRKKMDGIQGAIRKQETEKQSK